MHVQKTARDRFQSATGWRLKENLSATFATSPRFQFFSSREPVANRLQSRCKQGFSDLGDHLVLFYTNFNVHRNDQRTNGPVNAHLISGSTFSKNETRGPMVL